MRELASVERCCEQCGLHSPVVNMRVCPCVCVWLASSGKLSNATVSAVTDCALWGLDRAMFQATIVRTAVGIIREKVTFLQRCAGCCYRPLLFVAVAPPSPCSRVCVRACVRACVGSVKLLSTINPDHLYRIAEVSSYATFSDGDIIVEQGVAADVRASTLCAALLA